MKSATYSTVKALLIQLEIRNISTHNRSRLLNLQKPRLLAKLVFGQRTIISILEVGRRGMPSEQEECKKVNNVERDKTEKIIFKFVKQSRNLR